MKTTEQANAEQMWRLLWSHAAYQVISGLSPDPEYERVAAGLGWGLRHPADRRRAILIHPSANAREVGDLSLTVLGHGTQVIPRCNHSYVGYLHDVADIVETTARVYLSD